ncbi:L-lysine 2,3-aminomutase [BD1-7 clade bacterium]|uniref:L-lysine 2,3-aminomutase n=1 Tax=BD1-7 clade bacterium TaxID=2029982 RepID=A0A5S9MYH5_9GAMM|nr:L-lysine 2,3-aminomutase [BD1-7 clade bacterium]CAA0082427.1 L-lysine 2,3-aminomutase [BD1-7 clade bacterium]
MITRTAPRWQTSDWQSLLKSSIRSVDDLCDALNITVEDLPIARKAGDDFAVKVPLPYLQRIRPGTPNDPLLLQVLPQALEMQAAPGFSKDPLEEAQFNPVPGLIHKYHGRVLLISSPHCAIHCRYCFRRHFAYDANTPGRRHWQPALDYIATDSDIYEVILSGGDPLSATDSYLHELVTAIAAIPHVKTLRLHTRLPVVIPQRVTQELLDAITGTRLKPLMVLHINHSNEIDDDVAQAVKVLQSAGIRLLNQSVLLRGVNDSLEALSDLLWKLYALDVGAYYLHVLDMIDGAAHFLCDDSQSIALYNKLAAKLPGYMLPRLVRETASHTNKTPLI